MRYDSYPVYKNWLSSQYFFFFLLLIFPIIFPSQSFALDPKKNPNQYLLSSWQDGLPHQVIRDIIQSKDGYLWLATYEGLVRFDGVRFTVFDKKSAKEFKTNRISAICEDHLGNIWAATTGGLLCYRAGEFVNYTTKENLPSNAIYSIYEDKQYNLWIGTNQGLVCYKEGKITTYTNKNGLSDNLITRILESHDGKLWIGTNNGLSQFSGGNFLSYKLGENVADNFINTLREDKNGLLWIGTNGGLKSFQNGNVTFYKEEYGLSGDSVSSILEDQDGNIWFGGYGIGLVVYRQGKFITFSAEQGFSDNIIRSLCEDSEGSLWIGTNSGLSRLRDGNLSNYTSKHGLLSDNARSVWEAKDGSIWIGTDGGGIARLFEGKFTNYTVNNGLIRNFVRSVYEDSKGNLWIGTTKGLSQFTNNQFTSYPINDIFSIYEDKEKNLWIGTYGYGIYRLTGDKFTNYTKQDGLSSNIVRSFYQDSKGNLWLGTEGGGLGCFKDGKFTNYTKKDGLAGDSVLAIYIDKEDYLWISTENGINRFKNGQFVLYNTQSGLFDDLAFQILEDNSENFWVSCNKGIYQVSRKDLMNYALGTIKEIPCVSYTKAEGMGTNQCNGNSQPAGCKSRDGKLWFPTVKGVVSIDPSSKKINKQIPNVVIEKLIVNEKPFYKDNISLEPDIKTLEFNYAGLSFIFPEKVKFKYKLEGFDTKWSEEVTRRFITYNNLPPGDYTFKVKACNNDGIWNEAGASYHFTITPHWWQTYWANFLEALALVGIIFAAIRLREQRLLQRNLVLEAKVLVRTKELDQKNEELAEKVSELDQKNSELDKKNDELANKNAALIRSRDELIQSNKRAELIFSALSDVLPGTVLDDKYRIESKIGAGGFGAVYRATHLTLMRAVAVKVFRPSAGNTSIESLERFKREGITGSMVNHPNAVAVLDSGISASGIAYLVMELLEGYTLTKELEQEKYLTPWRCAEIIIPVCEALDVAHSNGLIHRDIKPDNIFLHQSSNGEIIKVVDFGIAKLVTDTQSFDLQTLTESGIVGTPTFIAPERLSNKPYDGRADVYSIGVLLYRMLAGRLPFQVEDKNNVWAVALMHLKETPQPIKELNPNIPEAVAALVMKLLAKEPEDRFTAKEFAEKFASVVGFQAKLGQSGQLTIKADFDHVLEASTIKLSNKTSKSNDETKS